jgi:two-component system heavy metal sensor histidine kinase CusS
VSRKATRPRSLSLALRIAISSTLIGMGIVAAGVAVGYWALSRQLEARAMSELHGKRDMVVHLLSEMPSLESVSSGQHRFRDVLIGHDDMHLAVADAGGRGVLVSFSPLASEAMAALDRTGAAEPLSWRSQAGNQLLALRATAPVGDGAAVKYYLALDRQHDSRLLRGFLRASLLGLPLLLGAVALGAWMIARTGLAPLRRFRRVAARIGTRSLSQRLSEAGLPTELQQLAQELNAMLSRIDEGYRRLQEFSGDLAHELRTPIATLFGRSQVALSQQRTPEELRDVLEGNIEELERLSRLVADMLFIAQAEDGQALVNPELVSLDQEARRVADYLALMAEERQVRIDVVGEASVLADRLLVQRAITNLLSNAVRHAQEETAVLVSVESTTRGARLHVANDGDTVAPEHLSRIFDRFFRADPSRARRSGGAGLGLAIVRSIMLAHGGEVTATSDPTNKRTTFTLSFVAGSKAAGDAVTRSPQ